jgi:uncharacterized surface protein with fasciclin (FAS1) repeats
MKKNSLNKIGRFARIIAIIAVISLTPAYLKSQTVVDIIVNSENHTVLETAVIAAGLTETLSGAGPFTVFAPTDDAFAALPAGLLDELLLDPTGQLTQILLYHVVGASAMSSTLTNGQVIETLHGNNITISITDQGVFVNEARVSVADITAINGVVHVIDAVLVPQETGNTVFDIIASSDDHTLLETALIAAGLDVVLQEEGPYTVFAPTDEAVSALPEGMLEALLADPSGLLTEILLYHVIGRTLMAADLEDAQVYETLLGDNVTVTILSTGEVYINNARVVVADLQASNGVVHVINTVLVPPTPVITVMDVIANSEVHTTLEAALIAAELDVVLRGEGPFTVFAPTDAAFGVLGEALLQELLATPSGTLTDILLYHVVGGNAPSAELSDQQQIETLFGESIMVNINQQNEVFINQAKVIIADIVTSNGVVHVIDAVLMPQTTNTDNVFAEVSDVKIYPNPARNNLTVELALNNPAGVYQIELMNITGSRVALYNIGNRNNRIMEKIDVSFLPQGIYLLNIRSDNEMISRKINVVK